MRTFIITLLISLLIDNSYAQSSNFYFDDKTELSPKEIKIWKYKMSKLSIRHEYGKWEILQGINTTLTDMQLLKLINSEEIGYQRLKNIESKQNIGNFISFIGLFTGLAGALLITDIFKFDNSKIYGISGIVGGIVFLIVGASLNPLIQDESDHILTIEEAKFGVDLYNKQLRESLGLKENEVD